ncbi:MAG: TetR family transcriptional regulator [Smithellaceae bacterium]|jgi:TetR/AcrR family transcriptional regulator, fatty acid metabolism regulator protein|nr:TetR family transcriptional regulator [Smithellaceae bacterium]MDD3848826.1 TetR family transcriptional regulator [Smithellaceae bacterium]
MQESVAEEMNERNKNDLLNLRRSQLTAAAYKVVAQKGYNDFTIKDIAEEAGLSTGLVHYYFKNKEDLLFKLLKEMNANLRDNLKKAMGELAEPRDKLMAFCDEAFALVDREKAYFYVLIDFWAQINHDARIRQANVKLFQSYRAEIAAIIQEGAAKGVFTVEDVNLTSVIIIALIQGTIIQYAIDREAFNYSEIKEKIKEQILSRIVNGK